MGQLTGSNTFVAFLSPRIFALALEQLSSSGASADHRYELTGPNLYVRHAPGAQPELRLQFLAKVQGASMGSLPFDGPLEARLLATCEANAGKLSLRIAFDQLVFDDDDGFIRRAAARVLTLVLQTFFAKLTSATLDISLEEFDLLTGDRPGTWHFAIQLLGPDSRDSCIAILARFGAPTSRLEIANPLPFAREVALAVSGEELVARVTEKVAALGEDQRLPLGFAPSRIAFEMRRNAVVVSCVLKRQWRGSDWGAAEVRANGRLRLRFDRLRMNSTLDVGDLKVDFHAGVAWAAALIAPIVTAVVLEAVRALVRSQGPKLVAHVVDERLDRGEDALLRAFSRFATATNGLAMTLHDAALERGDLWLTGDVEKPADSSSAASF